VQYEVSLVREGSMYRLSFPAIPEAEFIRPCANSLFEDVEHLLAVGLTEHLRRTGTLPECHPADGLMIAVRPHHAAKLILAQALFSRNAGTPEKAAEILEVSTLEAEQVSDPLTFTPMDDVMRALEMLGIEVELRIRDVLPPPGSLGSVASGVKPPRKQRAGAGGPKTSELFS
jgi:hypothetical protein